MCGIAGLICFAPNRCTEDHSRIVTKMCDLQVHRGPDDRGIVDLGQVWLGSNRLSIIDLSPAGHMPMSDGAGWWIVYNGEVYNFAELRTELIGCGHEFHSRTDTEVVLRAFTQWGEACLDRFRGMFAFAIYDSNSDTLTLARDPFGKKPLYYMRQDGHALFASELKSLASACSKPEPNHQRLAEWSLFRNVDFGTPDTLFAGISSLPPGHVMQITAGQIHPARRYFAPEDRVSTEQYTRLSGLSPEALTQELGVLITTGVRERLVSDVPVGTLCSGGIDSSLITAVCSRERKDVLAFNVSLQDHRGFDESIYANQVARHLGIRLVTCHADGQVFRDTLVRAIYHSDLPLTHANSVFFLNVAELARSHGVPVLLSGEGADELFGGYVQRYRRYRQFKRVEAWLKYLPERVRRAIAFAGYACDGVPITEFSEYGGLLAHAISFLDRFARVDLLARCANAYNFVEETGDREVLGAMLADLTNFLTPLLRRMDRMTMAASVECRAPFLDRRLVDTVANVPLSFRLHGATDKWVLKAIASGYLPRDIVHRRKSGFPLPIADYLAPLAHWALFDDGFCLQVLGMHRMGLMKAVRNYRQNVNGFFNLLSLEIWGRLFFLRQSVEEVTEHVRRTASVATHAHKTRRADWDPSFLESPRGTPRPQQRLR